MDHLAKAMGEEGEYATFVGSLNSKSHNEWVEAGMARQKEKYPRMTNVANKIEDYEDQNKSYEKMKELLVAHPNLKGVQTSAMGTAAGTGLAVEERGPAGQGEYRRHEPPVCVGSVPEDRRGQADLVLESRRRRLRDEPAGDQAVGGQARPGRDRSESGRVPIARPVEDQAEPVLRQRVDRRHERKPLAIHEMTGAAAADPFLALRSIRRSFGGVQALDGVTLDVRAGEVHCLAGENGSGKVHAHQGDRRRRSSRCRLDSRRRPGIGSPDAHGLCGVSVSRSSIRTCRSFRI